MLAYSMGCNETGAFAHDWYYTMNDPRNTMRFITNLKNDIPPYHAPEVIHRSEIELYNVLREDFSRIIARDRQCGDDGRFVVCGVPRSKREASYPYSQMGLKRTIRRAVTGFENLLDGLDYIVRHTDTKCTHRARSGHGGAGEMPRLGLIKDTCHLSGSIYGQKILLVDDIYTAGVGIDEDAIGALYGAGAREVVFYSVGFTKKRLGTNNNVMVI